MDATVTGPNRTGTAVSPEGTEQMLRAASALSPFMPIDTSASEEQRIVYINESEAVGSIPPPVSLKGTLKSGMAKLLGGDASILMDKVGERIAYERSGARLYDALLTKYRATGELDGTTLPTLEELAELAPDESAAFTPMAGESGEDTLIRIRSEELEHFRMLCDAMEQLGGDPTAQTPCADVIGTASMGFMQVLTDPRTTLAQCLNVMLSVELTDNAAWELLIQLADDAGQAEISGQFLAALGQEQQHMAIVKAWLTALVTGPSGTAAV